MNEMLHLIPEQSFTVFLWSTRSPHTIEEAMQDSFYPQYLFYDYEIDEPQKLHNALLTSGYYAPATLDDILSSFTSNQLKLLLKENSLATSGNKAVLISRIKECIPQNILEDLRANSHLYSLSALGNTFVNKHYDYVLLHKYSKWGISLDELNNSKSSIGWDPVSFRDAAWQIFNERILLHSQEKDFDNLHSDIQNLSEICLDFDKNYRNGVYYLLVAFYLDVNCLEYYFNYKLYCDGEIPKKRLYSLCHGTFIVDFFVKKIKKYKDYIDSDMITKACSFATYPLKLYTTQDFLKIISEIIHNDFFDIEKWQDFSQERFISFLDSLT